MLKWAAVAAIWLGGVVAVVGNDEAMLSFVAPCVEFDVALEGCVSRLPEDIVIIDTAMYVENRSAFARHLDEHHRECVEKYAGVSLLPWRDREPAFSDRGGFLCASFPRHIERESCARSNVFCRGLAEVFIADDDLGGVPFIGLMKANIANGNVGAHLLTPDAFCNFVGRPVGRQCGVDQPDSPNTHAHCGNGEYCHEPLGESVFHEIKVARAGYDWRIIAITALLYGAFIAANYMISGIVIGGEVKKRNKNKRRKHGQ